VKLDAFRIARYPITVAQFRRFVEDPAGYASRRWWTPQGWAWKQENGITQRGDAEQALLNHPVVGVAWYEAAAFCAWLTHRRREVKLLRGGEVIRLPTEAEWEVAAMWDPQSGQMRAWRPPTDERWQNVVEAGQGRTSPVGLFPQGGSPSGALDMAGNVWEWCSSAHAAYPQGSGQLIADFAFHETGPALRGGAYNIHAARSGWGARVWYFPNLRYPFQGFRVVLALKGIAKLFGGYSGLHND
jgi:formylglycine-generating enzyme required for sulfatase activity